MRFCIVRRGGGLIIELEHAGPPSTTRIAIKRGDRTASSRPLPCGALRRGARMFRDLTGYDRVMVYRFDEQVMARSSRRRSARSSKPFSATAIPLPTFRRSRDGSTSATACGCSSTSTTRRARSSRASRRITGEELDMSLCFLRSMSPIHLQYLKNMGVAATLVVSLMVGGELWGLDLLPSLCAALHPFRNARRLRTARGGHRARASRRWRASHRARPNSPCAGSSSA